MSKIRIWSILIFAAPFLNIYIQFIPFFRFFGQWPKTKKSAILFVYFLHFAWKWQLIFSFLVTLEHFIPYSLFIFHWLRPTKLRKCLFTFFKSLACLALQTETIVKKITQPKSPKTKNELTKNCNEPGISDWKCLISIRNYNRKHFFVLCNLCLLNRVTSLEQLSFAEFSSG